MTRRLILVGLSVAIVVLALLALWIPGGTERYDGPAADAPAWTAACREKAPRGDRKLLSGCARVSGRVLWVRRQGVGASSKAHVVLASHFGVVLARMSPYTGRRVPAIGHFVTIVGPLVRSRAGVTEVEFFAEV